MFIRFETRAEASDLPKPYKDDWIALPHPLHTKALNVAFRPLARANYIRLFHSISVYARLLRHLP